MFKSGDKVKLTKQCSPNCTFCPSIGTVLIIDEFGRATDSSGLLWSAPGATFEKVQNDPLPLPG